MSAAGSVLLDTTVVVAHLRGDAALTKRLISATILYMPWVVLGELHYGALRSRRPEESRAQVLRFQQTTGLLFPSERSTEHYGAIKAELANAGTPIPENDIWIAALAREYQLPVATLDRHFTWISGLQAVDW